jgi:ATP-dependent helicase/nuclease subunit B
MRVAAQLMAAATAGHTVLTPNAELAAALVDAVEREYRRLGREVWPTPRIKEFSNWLRELHAARLLVDSSLPRCLNDVEERELWRAVIEDSAAAREFTDPAAAARAARRARRTLLEYGIPMRAVAHEPAAETQAFLQWNQDFELRCRQVGCISVDALLERTPPPTLGIAWIESPGWRPVALRWLSQFGRPLRAAQIAGADSIESQEPRTLRHQASSPELEIAAAADWAARRLGSDDEFRAWILVRDLSLRRAEVVDAFDAALAPSRFDLREQGGLAPYAVAGGTPLADYAPVRRALQLLTATVGLVSFQRFSELLRTTDLHASLAEAASAAHLEIVLRSRAPAEAELNAWLERAGEAAHAEAMSPPPALQRLQTAARQLQSLRGAQSFSAWVPIWMAAIEAAPWIQRSQWTSVEFQAAERFRELLSSLAAADSVIGSQSRESAQRVLRRAARDTPFQPQTGVPAIWVSGQLMDPWLNYDGLWITGCSDDRWPAPVMPVALLPIRLQREFGVTSASAEFQMQSAVELQSAWQWRAPTSVFSWADAAQGIAAAPSPLLPRSSPMLEAASPLVQVHPHWHALRHAAPRLERFTDEVAPPFGAGDGERTHGVATLRAQSRCAFRGFAESRLQAEQLEMPIPGFNPRERGELVHYALEHIWAELEDSIGLATLEAPARSELLQIAAELALRKVYPRRQPGRRWREREHIRLQNLLGKWLDTESERSEFRVEQIEDEARVASFSGLDFRVRIDRIDSLADGARVLIDYKTGSATADWRSERPDNPQLPIYALLQPERLIAVAYGSVNAAEPRFEAESERRAVFNPSKRASKMEDQPSFAALVEVWRARIEKLAAEFAQGRAEVAPTLKACGSCHLHGLCRVPGALDADDEEEGESDGEVDE